MRGINPSFSRASNLVDSWQLNGFTGTKDNPGGLELPFRVRAFRALSRPALPGLPFYALPILYASFRDTISSFQATGT